MMISGSFRFSMRITYISSLFLILPSGLLLESGTGPLPHPGNFRHLPNRLCFDERRVYLLVVVPGRLAVQVKPALTRRALEDLDRARRVAADLGRLVWPPSIALLCHTS
jgi:hypothetical protein